MVIMITMPSELRPSVYISSNSCLKYIFHLSGLPKTLYMRRMYLPNVSKESLINIFSQKVPAFYDRDHI